MKQIAVHAFLLLLAFACAASLAEPVERNAQGERIWHITDYLKGTSPQIHDLLCGEMHRLHDKIAETEQAVADDNAAIANDKRPIISTYLKRPEYPAAKADVEKYKAQLDQAHAAHDTAAAMQAGSLYNKARDLVASLERSASAAADRNDEVKQDHARLKTDQDNLTRLQASEKKAIQWHDELVAAMRNTALLQWPLAEQRSGILGEIIPTALDGDGNLICNVNVREDISTKDSGEGMVNVKQLVHPVRMIVKNVNLRPGDITLNHPMRFDRNVEVESGRYVNDREIEAIVVVEAKHADIDDLMDAIAKP